MHRDHEPLSERLARRRKAEQQRKSVIKNIKKDLKGVRDGRITDKSAMETIANALLILIEES